MVVGRQLGRLEDHLQVRVPARLLDLRDLLDDARVVAGQVRLAGDHHVDLVRAGGDRLARVLQAHLERALPGRERGRDRRDVDAGARPPHRERRRPAPGRRRRRRSWGSRAGPVPGRRPWRASWRTLPGVSAPSSVVRSSIEIARRIPCCLDSVLIERLASVATRSSTATRSTCGRRRTVRTPSSVPPEGPPDRHCAHPCTRGRFGAWHPSGGSRTSRPLAGNRRPSPPFPSPRCWRCSAPPGTPRWRACWPASPPR